MSLAAIYRRFPTRIIVPTREAVEAFARTLPGLHRPAEVAASFLVTAVPYLVSDREFTQICYEIADGFYDDDDLPLRELSESSIAYTVDNLVPAFLAMCEAIYQEIHALNGYRYKDIFPYDLCPDDKIHVLDGIVMKKISFEDFKDYLE
jgi:hypothetical protein